MLTVINEGMKAASCCAAKLGGTLAAHSGAAADDESDDDDNKVSYQGLPRLTDEDLAAACALLSPPPTRNDRPVVQP